MEFSRHPQRAALERAALERSADPRAHPPNANLAGPNEPPQSVGPTSSSNDPAGDFVLNAEAWSGWPDPTTTVGIGPSAWNTPYLEPFGSIGAGGGMWSGFGYGRHHPEGYFERVATVGICVDLNTRQLASFPAYAVRQRVPHDLPSWYSSSPEPELYSDWVAFMKVAANVYQLAGECILWATGRFFDGFPARFVVLNPYQVDVDEDGEYWVGDEHLARADVCHINYQQGPAPAKRGIGPLRWAARHLVSAAALDRYATDIAQYGVWAVLRHPQRLTAEQSGALQAQWCNARYRSGGAPAVLSGGVEFDALTLSPRDMALLDLKTFDLQMIAAAFGIPAFLVNLPQPGSLTYSSTAMLADWHWRSTLRPMAQAFSGAMSQWLLPRGTVIEFNPDRYVQPPLEERARAYVALHGIQEPDRRAMTVDEIRMAERFTPYPDPVAPLDNLGDTVDGLIGAVRG